MIKKRDSKCVNHSLFISFSFSSRMYLFRNLELCIFNSSLMIRSGIKAFTLNTVWFRSDIDHRITWSTQLHPHVRNHHQDTMENTRCCSNINLPTVRATSSLQHGALGVYDTSMIQCNLRWICNLPPVHPRGNSDTEHQTVCGTQRIEIRAPVDSEDEEFQLNSHLIDALGVLAMPTHNLSRMNEYDPRKIPISTMLPRGIIALCSCRLMRERNTYQDPLYHQRIDRCDLSSSQARRGM